MLHGLEPCKLDHRDYDFHKTFQGTVPATFPSDFSVENGLWIPNQNEPEPIFGNPALPYGCTDYASNDLCADQDGVLYNPIFTERMTNANARGGIDIRTSLNSLVSQGSQDKGGRIVKRTGYFNIKKYANLDWFDSIRFCMLQTEKCSVSWGTPWFPEWEDSALRRFAKMPMPSSLNTSGVPWHNSKFSGWKTLNGEPYLINKSWQGVNIGDGGFLYFSREVVNAIMEIRGTCAFTVSKTDKPIQTIDTTFIQWIISTIRNLFKPMPQTPEIAPPQAETLLFDTPEHAYHSVRVLCDNLGLSVSDKNTLCACLYQESRFNNGAINKNRNDKGQITSIDVGICQVNSYYHCGTGKGFPSTDYVIEHPQEAVEWMINMMKNGKLNLWTSYKSGAYKQWLSPNSPMWLLAT